MRPRRLGRVPVGRQKTIRWNPRSTSAPLLFSVRIATPFTFDASDATLTWAFCGGLAALGSPIVA
jgi:hypothetical protein